MSAEAREAVGWAIAMAPDDRLLAADAALASLQPIIAAEIRAWAREGMARLDPGYGTRDYVDGHRDGLAVAICAAERIASRICGGDA